MMVPMNEDDFNEMWYKVNKLTTLIYPQWSEGTLMDSGDSTFIQPFSQVPTASPLCRLRVGDLFTSNYSKVAMARMMGIGNEKFKYTEPGGRPPANTEPIEQPQSAEEQRAAQKDQFSTTNRFVNKRALRKSLKEQGGYSVSLIDEILVAYDDNPESFTAIYDEEDPKVVLGSGPLSSTISLFPKGAFFGIGGRKASKNDFLSVTKKKSAENSNPLTATGTQVGLASLFRDADGEDGLHANPIFKSFHSTMGRGIAVAVTGLDFDWKLNTAPWNLKPGSRAPRMCEVQLSIVPIHDITPGLDHHGINRAPIYKVGEMSESLTGDVWYNTKQYDALTSDIEHRHDTYLRGEEKHLKNVPEE